MRRIEEKHDRRWFGMFIPAAVWNCTELNCVEKCLYAEMHAIGGHDGQCYASNEYLGEAVGVGENRASVMVSKLIKLGFAKVVRFDGRKRYIKTLYDRDSQVPDFVREKAKPLRKQKGCRFENAKISGKPKCEGSKEAKESKVAPAIAVAVPETPQARNAVEPETGTATEPTPYTKDSGVFWLWVTQNGLVNLFKRRALFEEMEAIGWVVWNVKRQRMEKVNDRVAFLTGLDRKIGAAFDYSRFAKSENDCPF